MDFSDVNAVYQELNDIRLRIERYKNRVSHFEKNRLLKMIDAELMDALHNLEALKEIMEE